MSVNPAYLRDVGLMHESLQQKLSSSLTTADLIPFLHKLCAHSELKHMLSILLRRQYEDMSKQTNNEAVSSNVIRSLFIETHKFAGIPSDDIHEYILSYLPSNDYHWIPLISKHFNEIMKRNANIYNEQKYEISLYENDNDINVPKWEMKLDHNNKTIHILPSTKQNKECILNRIPRPYNNIKIWRLDRNSNINPRHRLGINNNNSIINTMNLLNQNKDNIHSLSISSPLSTSYIDKLSKLYFKNCRCLEISFNKDLNGKLFADAQIFKCIQILSFDSVNMKSIIGILDKIADPIIYLSIKHIERTMCREPLRIPQSIEWLHLDHTVRYLPIDLSKCNKLIGMTLNHETIDNIIWNNEYMIPYAKLNYARDFAHLTHSPIRFLTYRTGVSCGQFPSLPYIESNDIVICSLQNILDQLSLLNDNHRCLLLDIEETDDVGFFSKLMRFAIRNKVYRNKRIAQYKELDKLCCAHWIKNICLRGF